MAQLNKVARCYRCGTILQTEDPEKEGYITPEIVDKYPEGLLLCNDCYKNERFSDHPIEPTFEEDFQKILEVVREKKAVIAYVIDLFSFEGNFISKLNEMIKGLDVIVIANKRDLLPKEANDEDLLEYVEHTLRKAKLDVKDVVLVSSTTDYNIDLMYEKIVKLAKDRDVFFVGASVSGKSSVIIELLKRYKNQTRRPVTLCTFKNTTLRGYNIPLTDKTNIYELPGTGIENSMLSKVERTVQNVITPKKEVKPRKIPLYKGYSTCLGGLCCVELLEGKTTTANFYISSSVQTKSRRMDGEKHLKYVLEKQNNKPCSAKYTNFNNFDIYEVAIDEEGSRDIGILDLGWFNFTGAGQIFRIIVPKRSLCIHITWKIKL